MVDQSTHAHTEGKPRWREALDLLKDSISQFFAEDLLTISASIAFYTLLAIFPFLILLLYLAGILVHHYAISGQLAIILNRYLPMKPDFIMRNLVEVSKTNESLGIISFLLLLWSASGAFGPLEKAMNAAWEVREQRVWWKSQILALEIAFLGVLFAVIAVGLVGFQAFVHEWMQRTFTGAAETFTGVSYHSAILASTFGLTLLIFIVLFRYLPNRLLRFREVLPSAVLTAVLWEISRVVFTRTLRHINYHRIYGSLAAMVTLMMWAYVSSAVMMLGARISNNLYKVLSLKHPRRGR